MKKLYYNSPIGVLEIICSDDTLYSLKIVHKIEMSYSDNEFSKNIKKQLDEYFSGTRKIFDINVDPQGTNFQKRVWDELIKISYGKTKTYGEIAEVLQDKKASRAVGNACNKNPIMIIIPCHRVISKNKNAGGFAYGLEVKNKLLNLEASL